MSRYTMDPPSFSRRAPSTQLSHPILGCDSIQSWKCDYMPTSHVAPKTIDEYISAFSPEYKQSSRGFGKLCAAPLPRLGNDQLQDPSVQVERHARLFWSLHEAHRLLPTDQRRFETRESVIAVCGREGQSPFSTRSTDPLRLDQAHHQASRETEPGETHNGAQKEMIAEQYPPDRCGSGINVESLPQLWFKSAFRIFPQVIGKFDPTELATHVSVIERL